MESGKRKMLIIDDEMISRELLSNYFEDKFEIIIAKNGFDGIKRIEEYGLSLSAILLDNIMPLDTGIDVLKYLNYYNFTMEMPVVMITADHTAGIEEAALDLGASDFIYKPYNPAVVIKRVQNLVDLFERTKQLNGFVMSEIQNLSMQMAEEHEHEHPGEAHMPKHINPLKPV